MPPPRGSAPLRLRLGHTILAQRRIQRLRLAKQQQQQLSARPESQRVGSARATYNMWVSTNKVLIGSVGGLKKTHCRNPNFDSEETKLLISLWGDPQVQRTLITTHKKHPVIAKLAEKMREYGYNRSTEEINTRIKNLKCFYNRIKKDLETGVVSETSWKHFAAMDDILTRPIFGNNHLNNAAASAVGRSRPRDRRHSDGSSDVPELPEDQVDHIDVKMELVSDDDKELRAEELLKNAEQVELREPNLLIPKDEPLDEDEDDPNDPDFEHDGGSETDDESSGMDEADETERSTRLRRRTKRVHKSKKSSPSGGGPTMTAATGNAGSTLAVSAPTSSGASGASVPGTIKIINYTGTGGNIKLSTAVPASAASTIGITTLAGSSGAAATTTTQSKISLVPTNFLLKPQASNLGFKQPIQLYTKPTVSLTGSKPTHTQPIVSTSAGAGNQPMKLFLVNTRPKDGSAPQQQLLASKPPQLFSSTSAVPMATGVSGLPKISIQPKLVTSGGVTALGAAKILQTAPATSTRVIATPCGVRGPSKAVGFKSLLSQLVGVSRENLGITKTRLVAERERFSNEKSVANAVLKALGELNTLLAEVNAASAPEPEDQQQQQQEQRIRITDVRHDETHRRRSVVGRALSDDEHLKTEVISDSEEG
ncbi:uncharacterized protein LOC131215209 [Anopheles bellator]|uniref:uncharacterized protein LOC131215209 n=1 Tax=Anopheles bellator TaxID=139047 RepID=UPI002649E87B|nr:uncharacterized protein LOC131215209 [Anopheles bellator]